MRAIEFLIEATAVGRDFQHLEDLLIVNGAKGGIVALNDLINIVKMPGQTTFKWDGGAAVFWGRNNNGEFIFVPDNQWSKEQFLDREGLGAEIRATGRPKQGQSPEDFAGGRSSLAEKYERIWDIFEAATPENFRGYVFGELMFTEPQQPDANGEYVFTPNKVTYRVAPNGLGGKMASASVFAIVHGVIKQFGGEKTSSTPLPDATAEQFNSMPELIVINRQSPKVKIKPLGKELKQAIAFIQTNARAIDEIANFTAPKFITLKKVLYDYAVQRGKSHGTLNFDQWLNNSKLSENHRTIVSELMKKPAWQVFWAAFNQIVEAKHEVIDQLHTEGGAAMQNSLGITASIGDKQGGEGFVSSLGKLVNPAFRSAPPNPRFAPEV